LTTYTYDPFGELISTTNGQGQTTSYTYDSSGDKTSINYPLSSTLLSNLSSSILSYGQDNAGNITNVSDFVGRATTTTYNKDGLAITTSLGKSQFGKSQSSPDLPTTITNTYDSSDSISSITASNNSGTILGFSYSRSPSGAIASQVVTGALSTSPGSSTSYL